MEKKIININGRTFVLKFDDFDDDVDIDSLLKIDYSNLIGELITFPVIVNRFGQLLAEAESQVSLAKLNLEVTEAKLKETMRIKLVDLNGKPPSIDAVNVAVTLEKSYQVMRKQFVERQKVRDYLNSIFWSAKDKSAKLDKLSLTIQPGDLSDSIIEGRINNVFIKKTKKLIKD